MLGRWDDALTMVAANRSVTDGLFGMDNAHCRCSDRSAARPRRRRQSTTLVASSPSPRDTHDNAEASICAAEVAAFQGAFADARRHAATAFEAIVTTDDSHAVAAECAIGGRHRSGSSGVRHG